MNSKIIEDSKSMSYALIAEKYGITRCAVAGIVWRHKNPTRTRIYEKNAKGRWKGGKCGRGWHGCGEYPAMTLHNTR